ncbi:DUF4007 family protein [Micromonospora sp. NPDC005189]|uniref:DUF4007 family protein n=1 Tax=Micromonospora sp. NPDC005189 TaxID=3157019 RepID=UPI0033B030A6
MLEIKLRDAAMPSFSRHETFAPRFGWLHKAYSALRDASMGSEVFLQHDAPVRLGVGKNMVNAIRFWSYAFKITVEYPRSKNSRANAAGPTWEARWLLDEDGADPYLEDPGSLWLLHWWLLSERSFVPTWWVAFNALPSSRFTEETLTETVIRQVRSSEWEMPVRTSIAKDADCLTKMYARRKAPTGSPGSFEDLLDCPFRELGLLEFGGSERSGDREVRFWQFTNTARVSLPARVIAYACLDYADRNPALRQGGSIALARLANEPGGPGRAFRLREPEIAGALEEVSTHHDALALTEGVGQRSLAFAAPPRGLAWDVLDAHYGNVRRRPGFPDEETWYQEYPEVGRIVNERRQGGWTGQLATTEAAAL